MLCHRLQSVSSRRHFRAFAVLGLVAATTWSIPTTSLAEDSVYKGKFGGQSARLEVHETTNGMRGALHVAGAKVNLRGKRDGNEFVGHMGPKSANVRFRLKPKGDSMVLTVTESGKKRQTKTLRRAKP